MFDSSLTITNPLWAMSYSAILKAYVERFPEATLTRVSCERLSSHRWCMACPKCLRANLYLLSVSCLDPDFDFDRALTTSDDARLLVAAARDAIPGRNVPWSNALPMPRPHYDERCDTIARIDLARARTRLSPDALRVLKTIVHAFGNVRHPHFTSVSRAAMAHLPAQVRDVFLPILAAHLDVVDDTPDIVNPTGEVWAMPWRYQVALPQGMPS